MPELHVAIRPEGHLEQLGASFKGIDLRAEIGQVIKKLTLRVEGEAKKVTPLRTGFLKSSILHRIEPLRGHIRPYAHYAGYVHEGTKYMKGRPFMQWGLEKTMEMSQPEKDFKHIKYKLDKVTGDK